MRTLLHLLLLLLGIITAAVVICDVWADCEDKETAAKMKVPSRPDPTKKIE